ncbi:MAG: 3-isopropylmalate dehydratase large subunit [Gammaproteobacteria bacterium]|nr:3-isopropylmalate dehydratase large subunit [Gammaproteobacteria bacterium]
MPKTIFEKIWDDHLVADLGDGSCLLHIDRVFLHERTGSIALSSMAEQGRRVKNPQQVFATMDHIVDTFPGRGDNTTMPGGKEFITLLRGEARRAGITLFDINDPRQGISHVISAEQGIALPGLTLVCPDSHTCTLGALGALAWGIGSSDCEHALVTETLRVVKPGQLGVRLEGRLAPGVTAKDVILQLTGKYTAAGASGCVLEFHGPGLGQLSVEARMTLCNMAVEFSAFSALIAPDETTLDYVAGRPYTPTGSAWDAAQDYWRTLHTDAGAVYDKELNLDLTQIEPSVTWGTSPQHTIGVCEQIPDPGAEADAITRNGMERALEYMDLKAGRAIASVPVDAAFIGSCTNSRLSDLRAAAKVLKGNKIAAGVKALCAPGSTQVKRAAEQEGLHEIFLEAGFEWREAGCSLCFYAGGEGFPVGARVITSTNRNFEGRQGPGVRSHLASPATVAASALKGYIADVRDFAAG